jgi:glutamine---fructose-6-phosphate transaminase (isomerizing)
MCGIFGVIVKKGTTYDTKFLKSTINNIAHLSEVRGKDSSGIGIKDDKLKEISVIKGPVPISTLFRNNYVSKKLNDSLDKYHKGENLVIMGHSRLVTNGSQMISNNNQPVIKDGIIGIHNGIIVNVEDIYEKNTELKREFEIDTEVLLALIRSNLKKSRSTVDALSNSIKSVYGTVSSAFLFNDRNEIVLVTNNGSLYIGTNYKNFLVFASEKYMLKTLLNKIKLEKYVEGFGIDQVKANEGLQILLGNFHFNRFSLNEIGNSVSSKNSISMDINFTIHTTNIESKENQHSALVDMSTLRNNVNVSGEKALLEYNIEAIKNLRRCTKCLLPETFPFIKFDDDGVCNICNSYTPKNRPKKKESLSELIEPFRKNNGEPECLVPFSGGRDSSFMLHYIVNELKMRPITFTYDWGMVTDLARRNIARICGKLGVENIIVSANIRMKRENIRKNVSAWLKKPAMGMIPLFMTGDKWFFYYINKLMKQTNTSISFSGSNSLENTDFKTGFSGIDLDFKKRSIDSLKWTDKLRLFTYIGGNVLSNPSYINSSVSDSLFSFYSRYYLSRENLVFFFGYVNWKEDLIEKTLINEYNWELSSDTNTSWRIGDGTVGFYNYIYYTVAGFSEIETFRSNQIREGLLTRDKGLGLIFEENRPRYESIKWYLETIGLNFEDTIKRINCIEKRYTK